MNMSISYIGNGKFEVNTAKHKMFTDLPEKAGGKDSAMTPVEIFVGSLGTCIGVFAMKYLQTSKLDPEGMNVNVNWEYDEKKTRIAKVDISLTVPNSVIGKRKNALYQAVNSCIVHNTLKNTPELNINLDID